MNPGQRIGLAIAIVLVDTCTPFIPLGSLFLAYVLLARPAFVPGLIAKLYQEG